MLFVLGQAAGPTSSGGVDIGSYIERFGFAVVVAGVLGVALWKVIKIAWEAQRETSNTWRTMYERERDLRIDADKRSEVALEQGKTTNALLEALKDRFRGGTS